MRPLWAESLPELRGDLVVVREVVEADAPTLYEMVSCPRVTAYMSPPPPSVHAFRGFVAWAQRERSLGHGACFGIVAPGLTKAVGLIQLRAQEPSWFTAQWGFAIGEPFWATGAFFDAAQLVVSFAFEHMHVHRLEARSTINNGRGNGLLQKLGARPEGALASALAKDGRYNAQFLWALHVNSWRQRPLLPRRFSVEEARASIAAAAEETTRVLREQRVEQSRGDLPPLYPFFVSES